MVQPLKVRCSGCGEAVAGQYLTAAGRLWHPDHFRCAGCGKAIGNQTLSEEKGRFFHPDCHARAFGLVCVTCGGLCTGTYFIDEHDSKICSGCRLQTTSCGHCGRTLLGATQCNVCAPFVMHASTAAANFDEAVRWMQACGLQFRWSRAAIRLALVEHVPRTSTASVSTHPSGFTEVRWTTAGRRTRYTSSVWMKRGLPALVYRGVAVHELGHVYLLTSGLHGLSLEDSEGFCELLSYLYYRNLQHPEAERQARRIRENPDAVYGGGFRKALALYTGLTLGGVEQRLHALMGR